MVSIIRQKKRLDFTIVDLGRTIKSNVKEYVNKEVSGKDALKWAVTEGNTTKHGEIPGGLGLSMIREFLKKNDGKIQIVSEDGYWEQKGYNEKNDCFSQIFPVQLLIWNLILMTNVIIIFRLK